MNQPESTSANAMEYFIDRHVSNDRGDRVAILEPERPATTYRELSRRVVHAAYALRALGVQPEQRVALLMPDGREFVSYFFAALKIGAVAVPLNTFANPEQLAYYLGDCRATVLVAHQRFRGVVDALQSRPELPCTIVEPKEPDGSPEIPATFPVNADDTALWLYTSGSTGLPKGVVHRHESLRICANNYGSGVLSIRPDDVCLSTSKLFFAYGLGNSVLFPFSVGAASVLNAEGASPERIEALLRTFRPSLFFSIPALYNQMLKAGAPREDSFDSVRMFVSAGEFLPAPVFDAWRSRHGRPIHDGIGSTEALHIFCSNRPDCCRAGASGVPVPGYDLRLVDDAMLPVRRGDVGRLLVKGQSVATGYWNRYAESRHAFRGEWLMTGDLYRQDPDGAFVYVGREGDAFKSAGLWVSPAEIEQALLEHPGVAECAVVAAVDESGLSVCRAFIVPGTAANESGTLRAEIASFLEDRLSSYKRPRYLDIVEALPKTATGKIARAQLRNSPSRHRPPGSDAARPESPAR